MGPFWYTNPDPPPLFLSSNVSLPPPPPKESPSHATRVGVKRTLKCPLFTGVVGAMDLRSLTPLTPQALVKSIIYQQLSTTVAAKIYARVAEACGGDSHFTPDGAQRLSAEAGRKAGLSSRKYEYIQCLAQAFLSGRCLADALFGDTTGGKT